MTDALVDFEEEWSKIKNGTLEIKWYYFPTSQSLDLDIRKIKEVRVRSQNKGWTKLWGTTDFKTWWACDMKRNFRSHSEEFFNVQIDMGETFKKGLTVHNLDGFLAALKKSLKNENIVYE